MMMAADGHAIAQSAKPQRSFDIGHTLVAVGGIIAAAADWRPRLVARRTKAIGTFVWRLLAAVDGRGHAAPDGIGDQSGCRDGAHDWAPAVGSAVTIPICVAPATIFSARCTTGASIILEPRLTTPSPCAWASS